MLKTIYLKHKTSFENWVLENYSYNYYVSVRNSLNNIFQYKLHSIEDIRKLLESGEITESSGSVAIRVLLNYIEKYELLDEILLIEYRKKIKIMKVTSIDTYVPSLQEVRNSIEFIKSNLDEKCLLLYLLMLESGMRTTELYYLFENYNIKYLDIVDNICIYNNFYMRGKKSSFFLFYTKTLYDKIKKYLGELKYNDLYSFVKRVQYYSEIVNLKYLRKVNMTILVNNEVDLEIANFIQSRESQNIGFNHYLSKKPLAIKSYKKIVESLEELR